MNTQEKQILERIMQSRGKKKRKGKKKRSPLRRKKKKTKRQKGGFWGQVGQMVATDLILNTLQKVMN